MPGAALFNAGCNMNLCFLLNPKKIWRRSVLLFSNKTHKTAPLIPKNDVKFFGRSFYSHW